MDCNYWKSYPKKGTCHLKLKEYEDAMEAFENGESFVKHNEECKKGIARCRLEVA